MTDQNKDDPSIELKLSDLANLILGPFNDAPIPSSIFHLIPLLQETVSKTNQVYFLELHPEHFHSELFGPRLYRYSTWSESHERYIKRKEQSELERNDRFILETNIRIIAKRLRILYSMDEKYSVGSANQIMRCSSEIRDIKLNVLDIELITTIKDIP